MSDVASLAEFTVAPDTFGADLQPRGFELRHLSRAQYTVFKNGVMRGSLETYDGKFSHVDIARFWDAQERFWKDDATLR